MWLYFIVNGPLFYIKSMCYFPKRSSIQPFFPFVSSLINVFVFTHMAIFSADAGAAIRTSHISRESVSLLLNIV